MVAAKYRAHRAVSLGEVPVFVERKHGRTEMMRAEMRMSALNVRSAGARIMAALMGHRTGFLLGAIGVVALAALLRGWGLALGLPHLMARPDDEVVLRLTGEPANGRFDLPSVVYPSAWIYLNWIWGEMVIRVGDLVGLWPPTSYAEMLAREPARLMLLGRMLTATLGTAAVGATIAVARTAWGRSAGLAAGLLLATSFLHARDAHSMKPDVALSLCAVAVLGACLALERRATMRRGLLAGAAIGAGMGCKYPGVLLGVPVWVAAVEGSPSRGWRRVLPATVVAAAAVALLLFVVTSPYVVFSSRGRTAVGGIAGFVLPTLAPVISAIRSVAAPPLEGVGVSGSLGYHLTVSLPAAVGWAATLLLPIALGWALFARPALGWPAASLLLVWIAVVGASPVRLIRYLTPVVPVVALLEGGALAAAARRFSGRHANLALALAVMTIALDPSIAIVAHDRLAARTDTRVLATRWLAANAPPGSRVAITGTVFWAWGEPQMPLGVTGVLVAKPSEAALDDTRATFLLAHDHPLFSSQVEEAAIASLAPRLSPLAEFDPFVGPREGARFEAADAYYLPLRGFDVLDRPGPRVRIWKVEQPSN